MGVAVLVLGRSGSGKSTSLRNFEQGEIGVLNVIGKPLPFRKRLDVCDCPDYDAVYRTISAAKRNAYAIDDAGYLMSNENFKRARERGYEKFVDMAANYQRVFACVQAAPPSVVVYVMMHTDVDAVGREKPRTVGKMLDEKYCIEGVAPVVLDADVVDGRHVFHTTSDGTNLAKAPIGMFEPVIDNDLKAVDAAIRDYWGLEPLTKADE